MRREPFGKRKGFPIRLSSFSSPPPSLSPEDMLVFPYNPGGGITRTVRSLSFTVMARSLESHKRISRTSMSKGPATFGWTNDMAHLKPLSGRRRALQRLVKAPGHCAMPAGMPGYLLSLKGPIAPIDWGNINSPALRVRGHSVDQQDEYHRLAPFPLSPYSSNRTSAITCRGEALMVASQEPRWKHAYLLHAIIPVLFSSYCGL